MDTAISELTDRELLEELVSGIRELRVALSGVGEVLSTHPMLKMFGGSLGSLLGK